MPPLWYGYTFDENNPPDIDDPNARINLKTPKGYVAASKECGIYPHYAYYYYNGQYVVEKVEGEDAWATIVNNEIKIDTI